MMKLKMLVVAAGFAALPVIAGAQTPTDTTMKTTAAVSALPAESVNGARPVPPSDGTTCPWGCPTSKGTAGLTGAQFLALQQEIRDKGCGQIRITGVLDGPTRRGISACAKKLGVKNNAAAVLVAMNIGYSDADVSAAKMEE
jgi:hypothetical protein